MKIKKIIASLLSFVLVFMTILPGMRVFADTSESEDRGMVISKNAKANVDGTYTITLEAFATGSKVITETTEDIPTDIVLVLDQSGSMDDDFSETTEDSWVSYGKRSNHENYSDRAGQSYGRSNLWYKLEDGSYVEVSVNSSSKNGHVLYTDEEKSNGSYYWNKNNVYYLVDGEYEKVTINRTDYNGTYTYSYGDIEIIKSDGYSTDPGVELYKLAEISTYEYSYTVNGNKTIIGSISEGADTVFNIEFFEMIPKGSTISCLAALKNAVTTFSNNVAEKAAGADRNINTTEDNINHRIAVVGYASSGREYNDQQYENTEVFVGETQYRYGSNAQGQYLNAFQSMDKSSGISNVNASIKNLDAFGGTFTNLGMEMANGIFKANPINEKEKRNRVVIVFTDGMPGTGRFSSSVADSTITQGNIAKNTYGASVYTVGIFNGANATSAGNQNGTDIQKSNWFMQNLSSNNGKVQTPSYYLSAANAESLNNIFQQISNQIESGGSSTTLSEKTVIKDIIAPAFELPEGANANSITVETYSCKGKNGDVYEWNKNATAMDATASVNEAGDQIEVSGFDFAENYVGTVTNANGIVTYRGHKLVISFKVKPKDGFLGGNNVYTNDKAGVYENQIAADANDPVLEFERPQVNVPIGKVKVTAQDKNVYLLGDLTAEQLQSGAVVQVGDVTLNMSENAENYGLATWQNEYVNIDYKDGDGNVVTALTDLVSDTAYDMSVTVDPKTNGDGADGTAATKQTGSGSAKVFVFKPQLTFKDSTVWYGDTAPEQTYYDGNLVETEWLHDTTKSTDVTMTGTPEPTITKAYTPDSSKIVNGKINSKKDIGVDVTAAIDDTDVTTHTIFIHNKCADTCILPTGSGFLLHVNTCQLTVKKSGGEAGEPYVITVKKDGNKYTELTLNSDSEAAIYELPVGSYTIEENNAWNWRYDSSCTDPVELSSTNPFGTITCKNTKVNNYWLNGFSTVVPNIFGVVRTSK